MVKKYSVLWLKRGYSIGYEMIGHDSKAPVIVLLNGSLFHSGQWDLLLKCGLKPHLKKYRILRYDYGGTGNSLKVPVRWDLHDLTAELKEILDELDLQKVHLFGLSKGTIVEQLFAAYYPERVHSLGGYGWFHFGYSKMNSIADFFASRLKHFARLGSREPVPLTQEDFNPLWKQIHPYIFESFKGPKIYQVMTEPLLRKLMFKSLAPTPLRVMYDWFSYAVRMMPTAEKELRDRYSVFENIPMLIQHARKDGTLPYGMAEELHKKLPHSELRRYDRGYNHVTPTIFPWQAFSIGKDYATWLTQAGF